jgi:protein phosphatase
VDTTTDIAPAVHDLRLVAGAATSAGNRRLVNEDSHVTDPRFCVVADGMGGHAGGGSASAIATDVLARCLREADPLDTAAIHEAVEVAHLAIRVRAVVDDTDGMGTTLVAAVVVDIGTPGAALAIAHAGDSRCYAYGDGRLRLVTTDHSLVREMVAAGRLTEDEAAEHPMRHVVTRALGVDGMAFADVAVLAVPPERLLLCSDGLSDELTSPVIGRVLAGIVDAQAAADRLIELALAGAARDNVTAVVIDVVTTDATPR